MLLVSGPYDTCYFLEFLYEILLHVTVETYIKMSSNAGWRNTMVITWLVLGWRESCPGFCTRCSFAHSDYGFIENKFFPRMCSKQIRIVYILGYKFNVIRYANEQGNRTAERHFWSPTTKKITHKWRRQEEELTTDK